MATTRLGDFGTPKDVEEPAVFGYFGVDVRVNPLLSELGFVDFVEEASTLDESNPSSILMVKRFFAEQIIHPDDFAEFWRLAKANGQGIGDLMELMHQVMGKLVGRPTQPLRDSSHGPLRGGKKSKGGYSSKVVTRLAGRPDLQLAIVRAREEQRAG